MSLPAVGTLSYNGYTFNASSRSSIAGRPLYDEADRTIIGVVYTLRVQSFVFEDTPGAGCDDVVADLRQRLNSPGRALRYQAKGFGDFEVNVGGARDVLWGPKPRLLRLEAVGANAIWRLEWVCEVAVPECSQAAYAGRFMAFNYDVTFALDADRYTTRTYSGYVEVPMTRLDGGRGLPDTADAYRERLNVPVPPGFKRTAESYAVSKDKRRLDFTITDREMPGQATPAGCTNARGRCRVETADRGLSKYVVTLSATYLVAKGQPRRAAYEAFFLLYSDRLAAAQAAANGQGILVLGLSIDEGLYEDTRRMAFDLSYQITSSLSRAMIDAGVWRAVPNTNWTQWSTSLARHLGPRGSAGLRELASADVIVDLCGTASSATANPPEPATPELRPGGFGEPSSEFVVELQIGLETELEPGTVVLDTLPKEPTNPGRRYVEGIGLVTDKELEAILGQAGEKGGQPPPPGGNGQPVVQNRVQDAFRVRLYGWAVTTWRPLPAPQLFQIGDAILVPHERQVYRTKFLGVVGETPIYLTQFSLWYRVIPRPGQRFKAPKWDLSNLTKKLKPLGTFRDVTLFQPGQPGQIVPRGILDDVFKP